MGWGCDKGEYGICVRLQDAEMPKLKSHASRSAPCHSAEELMHEKTFLSLDGTLGCVRKSKEANLMRDSQAGKFDSMNTSR